MLSFVTQKAIKKTFMVPLITWGLTQCAFASTATGSMPIETDLKKSIVNTDPLGFLQYAEPHTVISNNPERIRALPQSNPSVPVLDITYQWAGESKTVSRLVEQSATDALLVLRDGEIIYEGYFKNWQKSKLHHSWSIMKSFASAMVGQAIADGYIASEDDPVNKYVPGLSNNGYNGVSIRNVLQMSSGVKWDENYISPVSDIAPLVASPLLNYTSGGLLGMPLNKFATQTKFSAVGPQGKEWNYSSLDSQVLGMVLTAATGRPLREYLQRKLWQPLGMESPAWLIRDREGMDNSFAFLYATARDFARFGQMYLDGGKVDGVQIVPAEWVKRSTHVTRKIQEVTDEPGFSYGYQWWIPTGGRGDFNAWGIEGQYIYVDPSTNVVIVKLATDIVGGGAPHRGLEDIKAFRAIADHVSRP